MSEQSKNQKNYTYRKDKYNKNIVKELNILYVLPIIFTIAILPLIVKIHAYNTGFAIFDWFSKDDAFFDFFLYYKQALLIITAVIMVVLLLYYKLVKREKLRFSIILIPLGCYTLLAFLSSLFSDYKSYSFTGIFEQFESIFALLAYGVLLYYAFFFVQSERDIKYIIYALLSSVLLLAFICITQLIGHDFYRSELGWNLISNAAYRDYKDNFNFASQAGYSYLSFFNSNYIGMYVTLVLPIMFFMTLYIKKIWLRILFLIGTLGLVLCLYGSKSTSGFFGLFVSVVLAIIIFWRTILKHWKICITVLFATIMALFIFNLKSNYISLQIYKLTNFEKISAPLLSDIQTNDDNITIKYNDNILKAQFKYDVNSGVCLFEFLDDNNSLIASNLDIANGSTTILDERFPGFVFAPIMFEDNTIGFSVVIDGKPWYFTNQYKDEHSYYYINDYGKYTKINTAPSAVFTGYEAYASGRGYIWSRTIPLLKDTILLGTGADTFVFAFPQTDYVNLYNYGFNSQIMTKPHSLYLQIAVQTGVVSLIAFLTLYAMYFISSIRLYIKGVFNNIYTVVGASVLIGTAGYMVCGIANDSSVTVAPVFWLLLGIGLAMNQKVKKELQSNAAAK